ncbi:MAG: TRAP transporter substrate-binding protein [Spirochaetia bacterium]|nr:TRAP transporter substrate-binding protein [Spirochaetia bacterium]
MTKSLKVLYCFLVLLCVVSNATFAGGARESEAGSKPIEIAYGHGFMPDTPQHKASLRFKELVEKESGGRYVVNLFPSGQLGGASEMFEGLQMGTQEVTLVPTARISGFAPQLQLFDLPFLFPDRETAYRVMDGKTGTALLKSLEANSVIGVAYYEDGFKQMTSRYPLGKMEDFSGRKFRTMESPIIMEQFKVMGANPTPIAFSEAYNALQQGVVDGQENPLVTIASMKFFEVQKYMLMSSHAYLAHVLLFSKPWFDSLPAADQAMLLKIGKEIAPWQRNLVAQEEKAYLDTIKAYGVNILELSPVERARMTKAMAPVYTLAESVVGKALIDMALKEVSQ